MRTAKRDALLFVGLAGILAAVCACLFVFQPVMEKADALEEENLRLTQQIADLSGKMASKDVYEEQTARMRQEIEDIYQLFPVDVREEDAILMAINQEQLSPMKIVSIAINPLEDVSFGDETEEEETESGGEPAPSPLALKTRKVTINYEVSYEGLKRSVRNLCAQRQRTTIGDVIVAYDESTGLLQGQTTIDMFCVPGQEGKEYKAPDFNYVVLGTDNIFGTIEVRGEEEPEGLEAEDAGEQAD